MVKQCKILFKQGEDKFWYWCTVSGNGKKVGGGTEGYSSLVKAKEGFNTECKILFNLMGITVPPLVSKVGGDFLSLIDEDLIVVMPLKKKR